MTPIVVTCPSETRARQTVEILVSHGVRRSAIQLMSSLPLEEHEGLEEQGGTISWLVVAGAILGGICAYLLVSLTQRSYPIVTGGMPVVPLWTDGIIVYELTMLGAILATLLVLIVTAPLMHWEHPKNAASPDDGSIVLEITPASEEGRDKIETLLTKREPGPTV